MVRRDVTFTTLEHVRRCMYFKRGKFLIERSLALLNEMEQDPLDITPLIELNDTSMELGAMNSAWNAFSLAVFSSVLSYTQAAPAELKAEFIRTLQVLRPRRATFHGVPSAAQE